MLYRYKQSNKKQLMGYLSYIEDFKNMDNLQSEMKLYDKEDSEFEAYLFYKDQHCRGIIGVQEGDKFVIIRYVSLDPSYRNDESRTQLIEDLQVEYPHELISAMPGYTYLLKFVKYDKDDESD